MWNSWRFKISPMFFQSKGTFQKDILRENDLINYFVFFIRKVYSWFLYCLLSFSLSLIYGILNATMENIRWIWMIAVLWFNISVRLVNFRSQITCKTASWFNGCFEFIYSQANHANENHQYFAFSVRFYVFAFL